MKIATTITSERGKPVIKTGNEYMQIDITGEENVRVLRVHVKWVGDSRLPKITIDESIVGKYEKEYYLCKCGTLGLPLVHHKKDCTTKL